MNTHTPSRQHAPLSLDQALHEAIAHHRAGRLQDAEGLYRVILQEQPKHPDANHNLGVLAVQVKQPAASLPYFKAALEASPNQGQYWLSYIDALIQAGQADAARQVLEQGRQLGLNGEVAEALATRLVRPGDAAPPQPAGLERAIAHREAGRYKEAVSVLQSWLADNPRDASAYALLAQALSLDKQDEQAWKALNAALSIDPALPVVRRNHARLLLRRQNLDEALQAAQAACQGDAADPENQLVLAAVLGAMNQTGQAFMLLENVLRSRPGYAEALANRALLKLRNGDPAGALADVEKCLVLKPHLAQVWGMAGVLRHQLNDLPGAIGALEKALDCEPDNAGHMATLGEFKRQAGALDAAIALLERAVSIAPDNAGAWVNLGVVLQESQRINEARAAYARALEIAPEQAEVASNLGALAKEEGDWEEALRYFDRALACQPTRVAFLVNRAAALIALERYDDAEQSARCAMELEPASMEARLTLFTALLDQQCYEAAQSALDSAAGHIGSDAENAHRLAVSYATLFCAQNRWNEAEMWLHEALAAKPQDGKALRRLSAVLDEQGRHEDAWAVLQEAWQNLPGDADTLQAMANHYARQERWVEAEARVRQVLEARPDDVEAHNNLGVALKSMGRLDEAEASCHRAIQARPDYFEAHNNLGAILWKMSRPEEAEAYCRRSLQLRPDYAEALNNLGNILSSLGRLEEAAACYRKALESRPGWALLHFNLHPLQLNAADMAPAIKSLAKAVELEPANDNYRFFLGMMLDYSGNPEAAAEHFGRLERSAGLPRARLDAWRYIKSANGRLPITGSNIQAFRMGLGMAANEGMVLEFGVRFGASIRQIAALANQEVHGFDSFEGLPEQWHHEPKGMYSTKGVIPEVPDNVTLYAGWFEDTLPAFLQDHAGPVRFMNIDCDIYSSTKTVLDLLADRIIPGTVIVFDEYIGNEHWREDEFKAFQEAVARYGWDYEYVCFSFFTKQVAVRIVAIADAESRRGAQSNTDAPAGKPGQRAGATPGAQEMNRLVALFTGGQYAEAATLAQAMTERFPLHGFGWKVLGAARQQAGRGADALAAMQKAAELSQGDAEAFYNLGSAFSDLGRLDEAEASLRRALELRPDYAEAHGNLGIVLKGMRRLDEAEASYRQALGIKPGLAEIHSNLGNVLHDMGRLDEAEASYRQALRIRPDYAEAHCNLGNALHGLGRSDEAEASFRRALDIQRDYAEAYSNLGNVLHGLGRLNEAEASFRRALEIKPDYAEAHSNLANTLHDLGRLDQAEANCRNALRIKPDYAEAHCNLGNTLKDMGRLGEAEASYRRALQLKPDMVEAHGNLLFLHNYISSHAPSYCLAEARQFGLKAGNKIKSRFAQWSCARQPERLRIGLVSGDLGNHPVGYFLESLLSNLDAATVELIAYPASRKADELTARIRPRFAAWKPLAGHGDEAAARLIHSDGIHVLIDLSGHTRYNRLPMFAWKPAPVQVSWLGYFATTGVPEIDYLLGDRHVAPHDEAGHFTEKLWHLPECYLCFTEPDVNLEVAPLPALSAGHITFGCFNNLTKVSDAVVAVWAKILAAVPRSRLFLKTMLLNEPSMRELTLRRFAQHGIAADRLILESASPRAELLASYHRVDIALDPFPYPGGTTSVEGLWMGVPVITRSGDRFLSHIGETIAHNAGLPEWIAAGEDDYVARAAAHASDLERLAQLRAGLRQQVLASPLFDAGRFARHFEGALWGMWNRWLEQRGESS